MGSHHLSRAEHLVRGWIIAGTSTTLAAASHGIAGGNLPHLLLWALCTSLSALICMALMPLRLPRIGLLISVLSSQGLFHFLFAHSGATAYLSPAHTAHSHYRTLTGQMVTQATHAENSTLMLTLHLLAALFTIWVIRRGETTLAKIITTLKLVLIRILSFTNYPVIVLPAHRQVPHARPPLTPKLFWKEIRAVRGPPAVV